MANYTKMMETYRYEPLRERYVARVEKGKGSGWPQTHVSVWDTKEERKVYSYDRNYSFLSTFEPFRWWHEDREEWGYYALISPEYVAFQVLDLVSGEIVYRSPKEGWGFCPVSFYFPDYQEYLEEEQMKPSEKFYEAMLATSLKRRTYAFVQGCVWGDDWSWKVGTIDLAAIFAGETEVKVDERFGYFVQNGKLQGSISLDYFFDDEYNSLEMQTSVSFHLSEERKVTKSYLLSEPPAFTLDPGKTVKGDERPEEKSGE